MEALPFLFEFHQIHYSSLLVAAAFGLRAGSVEREIPRYA